MRIQNLIMTPALLAGTVGLYAQSGDAIIDKLVEKGILTVEEANELREEADKDFGRSHQAKTGLPDWVSSLRIGGDFRGRYEMFHSDEPTFVDRHRFRYRVRPGIVATIRDNFEVGFRLTSSEDQGSFGGDPISGNATFQNNGSKKFVYIDQAYAKWAAVNSGPWSATFTVGKMDNPFAFSDMVFDGDYTPEGFAQQFGFKVSEAHRLNFNFGQFALDEISASSRDPFMFGAQARLESKWNERIATSLGIGALAITSEQNLSETDAGSSVPDVNSGNTREDGVLANNFNPWVVDGTVTYSLESFPGYSGAFPIRFGAEYMNNPAADDENEGYALGVTFGKSGKKGLWDLSYRWKHLEADAWYEEVVDSDFGGLSAPGGGRARYASGTNVEGHIVKASYSPYDSITVGFTYFLTEAIAGLPAGFDESIGRFQLDAIWKF